MKLSFLVLSFLLTSQAFAEVISCKNASGDVELIYDLGMWGYEKLELNHLNKKIQVSLLSVGKNFSTEAQQVSHSHKLQLIENSKLAKKDSTLSLKISENVKGDFIQADALANHKIKGPVEGLIKIEKDGKVSLEEKVICKCESKCEEKTPEQGKSVDDSQRGVVEKDSTGKPKSSPASKGATKQ